jgi:hypothetical protein
MSAHGPSRQILRWNRMSAFGGSAEVRVGAVKHGQCVRESKRVTVLLSLGRTQPNDQE